MQDEPEYGLGQEPEAAEPDKGGDSSPDHATQIAELKKENQRLRADRRKETARRLVKEHSLPDTMSDLLVLVPEDQMEQKAKDVSDAMPKASTDEPEPPPKEPENADDLAAMASAGDSGGKPAPGAEPRHPEADLLEKLNGAKSWDEVKQIQHDLQEARKRRG